MMHFFSRARPGYDNMNNSSGVCAMFNRRQDKQDVLDEDFFDLEADLTDIYSIPYYYENRMKWVELLEEYDRDSVCPLCAIILMEEIISLKKVIVKSNL